MSGNIPYDESISKKLRRILRSQKLRSTFYTESTLRKIVCKTKDRVATGDKNYIVDEVDCSNYEAVYFVVSKRSLKSLSDDCKRSFKNYVREKDETAKHWCETYYNFGWDQKEVVDTERRLVPSKIKETIYSSDRNRSQTRNHFSSRSANSIVSI